MCKSAQVKKVPSTTISKYGKRKSLGTYDTGKEAARVYNRAVLKHANAKKKQKKQKKKVQKVQKVQKVKVTKSCNVGVQQKKKKKEKEKKEKEKKKEKKKKMEKKELTKKKRVQGLMELVGRTHFHDEMFNRQ